MPGKCGCGQLLCSCVIKTEDPLQISGNGTPDTPYLIKLSHDGKTDCAAVVACVGDVGLGDFLVYDKGTNKISVGYKGATGCNAVADCVSEHLGHGLAYDRASRVITTVTDCPATMQCVEDNLASLLDISDPGGNALQVAPGGKLLVKPAESGSPWDCNLTLQCLSTHTDGTLQVTGAGDAAKVGIKPRPDSGLLLDGQGVGILVDPASCLTVTEAGLGQSSFRSKSQHTGGKWTGPAPWRDTVVATEGAQAGRWKTMDGSHAIRYCHDYIWIQGWMSRTAASLTAHANGDITDEPLFVLQDPYLPDALNLSLMFHCSKIPNLWAHGYLGANNLVYVAAFAPGYLMEQGQAIQFQVGYPAKGTFTTAAPGSAVPYPGPYDTELED
ncbi:hypothetical protein [Streptacidiphilus cavernicola]|uniref:Uncharacterized protein n=1 Tax=Streptacidiphilus cavernicola TaxID=3342716 RepID=A0ABV6VYB1_9ACTN